MKDLLREDANLYFNIFDIIHDVQNFSYGHITYRWEKRFLGSL